MSALRALPFACALSACTPGGGGSRGEDADARAADASTAADADVQDTAVQDSGPGPDAAPEGGVVDAALRDDAALADAALADRGPADASAPDATVQCTAPLPAYLAPDVMLVVDTSGSMVSNRWDHDRDAQTPAVTRWASTYRALGEVLTPFAPSARVGLQRFPSALACPQRNACYNMDACVTSPTPEVGLAPDNRAAILAALPGELAAEDAIKGATPASAGVRSALAELAAQGAGGRGALVLVTDGAASCNPRLPFPDYLETYDESLAPLVSAALADDGVSTFVVGIAIPNAVVGAGLDGSPEANPFERLEALAVAGGNERREEGVSARFYDAANEPQLVAHLTRIFETLTDPTVDLSRLPGEGLDPDLPLSLVAGGAEVPALQSCAEGDGWAWVSEGRSLRLCGSYLAAWRRGEGDFMIRYTCP
ncbi:MAG: hypothetical protein KC613_23850 [Myxococcales bacterium]|nr:hypothetical protein [Myxococcales bacterium]